jgi:hypothetical protein
VRYSKSQISRALLTAQRLLKGPVLPATRIAQVLNPYMDCTEVGGVRGQLHDDMRSSIFARMGDAYRREGNVQMAAQWYRRASRISPGNHATAFAHMVSKHELADFYNDALETLEAHRRRWLAKPIILRFLLRIVGGPKWSDPEGREIASGEKRALKFLREHAMAEAA